MDGCGGGGGGRGILKQESFLQLFLLKYSSISSINIAVNILDIVNLVRRIFSGELFIKNAAFVG